jgi:hypothetical protein
MRNKRTWRSAERLSGFRRGIAEFGLDADEALIDEVPMNLSSAAKALNSLLDRCPNVEAVFCASDLLAAGVLFECQRIGVQVPLQLGIAGFDDIEIAARVQPPLTTVRLPHQSIGAARRNSCSIASRDTRSRLQSSTWVSKSWSGNRHQGSPNRRIADEREYHRFRRSHFELPKCPRRISRVVGAGRRAVLDRHQGACPLQAGC